MNSRLGLFLILPATAATLSGVALQASAEELGRVLSSTPIIQQVAIPQQICGSGQVVTQEPKTGAGATLGLIAGGAIGNAVGQGGGRAAATMLGMIGGALLGNSIEGGGAQVQNVQQCATQTVYENRTTGYNVLYEYAGKQYSVQMPQDPGPHVRLQVAPVGGSVAAAVALPPPVGVSTTVIQPVIPPPAIYIQPAPPPAVYTRPAVIYSPAPPAFFSPPPFRHFDPYGAQHGPRYWP